MYDTVIWDWNGTLFDDFELCLMTVNGLLARCGKKELTRERYHEIFRFPIEDYYRDAGFDFSITPYKQLAREYMDAYQPASLSCGLQKGAEEVLAAVKRAGMKQYLASASQRDYLLQQVEATGCAGYFDGIFGRDGIHAEGKQDIAGQIKTEHPGMKAVYIGDTPHDELFARLIGADCVLMCCGHKGHALMPEKGTRMAEDFSRLPALLGLTNEICK